MGFFFGALVTLTNINPTHFPISPSHPNSWCFSVPLAGGDGELIEIIQGIVSIPTSKDKPGRSATQQIRHGRSPVSEKSPNFGWWIDWVYLMVDVM
jgi:hypothetical protein